VADLLDNLLDNLLVDLLADLLVLGASLPEFSR
jgi:hypothetical protein